MSKKDHGWIKIFIFCLLIFIIFVVAVGHIALKKLRENSPRIMANFIEISADGFLSQIKLPDAEHKEAMDSIRLFTQDIRDGKVSRLKQSITIEELMNLLKEMKIAADESKIENREFKIDIAEIIREAIKKGMTEDMDVKYTFEDLSFKTSKISV